MVLFLIVLILVRAVIRAVIEATDPPRSAPAHRSTRPPRPVHAPKAVSQVSAWEKAERARRNEDRDRRKDAAQRMYAHPDWPDLLYRSVLECLLSEKNPQRVHRFSFELDGFSIGPTRDQVNEALERCRREGQAIYDNSRRHQPGDLDFTCWRLTTRGRRLAEEHGGDMERMNEAEKQRPTIDARGAGIVAGTISGGIQHATVNNRIGKPLPDGVDLAAVQELLAHLYQALAATDNETLTQLTRERAEDDVRQVSRELEAPENQRDPGRVAQALSRLSLTLAGVDGLLGVVNEIADRLKDWF
ncbi:hypothetical protein ACIQV3_36265 [Streptomyces sp. NPDC099050]|uniref:hypothetical protein n=1 Tax=Streptomyces sp. NPDC099050 TaxID=3366100 RepID=UPI00381244B1